MENIGCMHCQIFKLNYVTKINYQLVINFEKVDY